MENQELNKLTYNKQKKPEKKIVPVVSSKDIVSNKKSAGKKLADSFLQEDIRNIGSYILEEWCVPMIKKGILGAVAMMFFKEVPEWIMRDSFGRPGSSRSSYDRRSYDDYYYSRSGRRDYNDRRESRDHQKDDYRYIVLTNRDSAQRVIDEMRDMIADKGAASVADLLELCGSEASHVDNDWGWIREGDIGIKRVYNGFLIDVPEARYIGR